MSLEDSFFPGFIVYNSIFNLHIENIEKILDVLNSKKVLDIIARRNKLFIVSINEAEKYNSSFIPGLNCIVSSAPNYTGNDREDIGEPEYIFMHEIGHALQVSLTMDRNFIPESFKPIFEVTYNTKAKDIRQELWPDIFADSFSAALSYQTPLQDKNPFCKLFTEFSLVALKLYFEFLIEDAFKEKSREEPIDMKWTKDRYEKFKKAVTG